MKKLLGWLACQVQYHKWVIGSAVHQPDRAASLFSCECARCCRKIITDVKWLRSKK